MTKNQIISVVIAAILIFGGMTAWALMQKWEFLVEKIVPDEEITVKEEVLEEEEIFALTAQVLSIDVENNFLIVRSVRDQKEVKIKVSDTTGLIKIDLPEDRPESGYIITNKTEIKLSDFREGDYVSVRTSENIIGKTELKQVIHIYLLPR